MKVLQRGEKVYKHKAFNCIYCRKPKIFIDCAGRSGGGAKDFYPIIATIRGGRIVTSEGSVGYCKKYFVENRLSSEFAVSGDRGRTHNKEGGKENSFLSVLHA